MLAAGRKHLHFARCVHACTPGQRWVPISQFDRRVEDAVGSLLCVCARAHAPTYVCVRYVCVCVCLCVRACACVRVRACGRVYLALARAHELRQQRVRAPCRQLPGLLVVPTTLPCTAPPLLAFLLCPSSASTSRFPASFSLTRLLRLPVLLTAGSCFCSPSHEPGLAIRQDFIKTNPRGRSCIHFTKSANVFTPSRTLLALCATMQIVTHGRPCGGLCKRQLCKRSRGRPPGCQQKLYRPVQEPWTTY